MFASRRRENRIGRLAAASALGGALLAAGPLACQQKQPAAAEPAMSPRKVRALTQADAIISLGEQEIADAKDLEARDPASAERLRKEGQDQIAHGQTMKVQAAAMK